MDQVTEIFGQNVFDEETMRERLPKDTFRELQKTTQEASEHQDCQRSGSCHEKLGSGKRRHSLYTLVPAHDRSHSRETRRLHQPGRQWKNRHVFFRKGTDQGRT